LLRLQRSKRRRKAILFVARTLHRDVLSLIEDEPSQTQQSYYESQYFVLIVESFA
jgi:hypothetical protein